MIKDLCKNCKKKFYIIILCLIVGNVLLSSFLCFFVSENLFFKKVLISQTYIYNKETKVVHRYNCYLAKKIKEKNMIVVTDLEKLKDYKKCKKCF